MTLQGFNHTTLRLGEYLIDLMIGGHGHPLLLLHGFPETKMAWHKIANQLANEFTIILPDLPGYGDSLGPVPDGNYDKYSKRTSATVLTKVMQELGFNKFAVAGHDRGARIAYRLALDSPASVTRLALLNIIPTLEVVEGMNYRKAISMENWLFMAQPSPFPETMINADPAFYLNHVIDSWSANSELISSESRDHYLRAFKDPSIVASMCAEYRATELDSSNDLEDRKKGNRIQCSILVLWSEKDFPNSSTILTSWNHWASNVSGLSLPCGHFLMEESPEEVLAEFLRFFRQ